MSRRLPSPIFFPAPKRTPNEELENALNEAFRIICMHYSGQVPVRHREERMTFLNDRIETLVHRDDVDINTGNFTALSFFAATSKIALMEELLKKGARLDYCEGFEGATTLITATMSLNLYAIYLILAKERGPGFVNKADQYGNTPLHIAATVCSPEVVNLLLLVGADPNIRNKKGEAALDVARERLEITKVEKDRRNRVAVIEALESYRGPGDEEAIAKKFAELEFAKELIILLRLGAREEEKINLQIGKIFSLCNEANVNSRISSDLSHLDQISFLQAAANLGKIGLMEALLKMGADSSAVDAQGRSVLIHAIESGNPDAVRLIFADLKRTGKKKIKDTTSGRVIDEDLDAALCAEKFSIEIVKILFEEIEDDFVRANFLQAVVRILPDLRVAQGLSPEGRAEVEMRHRAVNSALTAMLVGLMAKFSAEAEAARLDAASRLVPPPKLPEVPVDHSKKLKEFLEVLAPQIKAKTFRLSDVDAAKIRDEIVSGADPKLTTESGWTILHFLARSKQPEIARLAIAKGAEFRANEGITPLDFAIAAGEAQMIAPLIEAADFDSVKKSLIEAINGKNQQMVGAIVSSEKFVAGLAEMEQKSRNKTLSELRKADSPPAIKNHISGLVAEVDARVKSFEPAAGAAAAPAQKSKSKREREEERRAQKEAERKIAEEKRKTDAERTVMKREDVDVGKILAEAEENKKISNERRAMNAEDDDVGKILAKKLAAELAEAEERKKIADEQQAMNAEDVRIAEPAKPFALRASATPFTPKPSPKPIEEIIQKVAALPECDSFRLKGSALYLQPQFIQRLRNSRAARDADYEVFMIGIANANDEAIRDFIKNFFDLEGDAVSIYRDAEKRKFNINLKHPFHADFVIYDPRFPPLQDWTIDLDALRFECKPSKEGLYLTFGFNSPADPEVFFVPRTSSEYIPFINPHSEKLLQRLCFFKTIGVIDCDLGFLIPPQLNCADLVIDEIGAGSLEGRLNSFAKNHDFSGEEKKYFLEEFRKLMCRDVPTKVDPEFYKILVKQLVGMLEKLKVSETPSAVLVPAADGSGAMISTAAREAGR